MTSLNFNVTDFVLDHCLQPGPKRLHVILMYTCVNEFHADVMSGCNDSKLGWDLLQAFLATYAQTLKSKGFRSGELGGQKVFGQKDLRLSDSHFWVMPLLGLVGSVAQCSILHEHVFNWPGSTASRCQSGASCTSGH